MTLARQLAFAVVVSSLSAIANGDEVARANLSIVGVSLEIERGPVATGTDIPVTVQTIYSGTPAPDLSVLGDLSGPGLDAPITLATKPGKQFQIPSLHQPGDYVLSNVRLLVQTLEISTFILGELFVAVSIAQRKELPTTNRLRPPDFELRECVLLLVEITGLSPIALQHETSWFETLNCFPNDYFWMLSATFAKSVGQPAKEVFFIVAGSLFEELLVGIRIRLTAAQTNQIFPRFFPGDDAVSPVIY